MKSEHRHELQENDLTKYAEKSLDWLKTYGNLIMVAIFVCSIAASIYIYFSRVNQNRLDNAWSELALATTPADYQSILNDPGYAKTSAAPWAMIQEGEHRLQEGIRLMFTERARGQRELEAARDEFQSILDVKPALGSEIRERALFGLARAQESLSNGKLDTAIATYEKLISEYPDTLFKKPAEARIKELKRPDAGQFYAWFSKQNPTTATTKLPADQKGPGSSKKNTATKSTSTNDLPTTVIPDETILKAPGAEKNPLPRLTPDDLPPVTPPVKKGDATKPADPKLDLPPLPATPKGAATKSEPPVLPALPPKSEPAKSDSAPKKAEKSEPAPKKTP